MSRYAKVYGRIWNDEKFRELSDRGKLLFLFLLTHPNMTALGAMRASLSGLAAEILWTEEGLREAFAEALSKGMAKHDERASLVWLPNFLKYNRPESPNVVKAWVGALDLIPECSMKNRVIASAKAFAEGLSQAFADALPKAFAKAMPNPEPYPEPEPKPKQLPQTETQSQKHSGEPATRSRPAAKERAEKQEAKTAATWDAYSIAYRKRYGVLPVRNAKVNGMMARLIERVPVDEAPDIAAFFVDHPRGLYVSAKHCVELLLRDCETLRTEWATNQAGTDHAARAGDRTAAQGEVFKKLIAEADERERADAS